MTTSQDVLAAMVHKTCGSVPWLCSEIAQRVGDDKISGHIRALSEAGMIRPVAMPERGDQTAWELTAAGLSAAPARKPMPRAEKPRRTCGGLAHVAEIMAKSRVSHEDAYRLSIMHTDPAYHPGNRLPDAMGKQQAKAERVRAAATAKIMNGLRQGDLSIASAAGFAGVSWNLSNTAMLYLVKDGMIEGYHTARGATAYRLTQKGRDQ